MRIINRASIALLCIVLVATIGLASSSGLGNQLPTEPGQVVIERSEKQREWEKEQAKARNKQRQEDLKKDTDKLLQLATDLKLAVDKSNEQTLSMDVIKKAEQIEKLSKSIQKKMKGD